MISDLISKLRFAFKVALSEVLSIIQLLSALCQSLKKKTGSDGVVGRVSRKVEPMPESQTSESQNQIVEQIGLNKIKGISSRRIVTMICLLVILLGVTSSMLWNKLTNLSHTYTSEFVASNYEQQEPATVTEKAGSENHDVEVESFEFEQSRTSFLPTLKRPPKPSNVKAVKKQYVPQNSQEEAALPDKTKYGQPYTKITNTITDTINPQFILEHPITANQQVSIIVSGFGINRDVSDQIIDSLPENVTLAVSPYTPNVTSYIEVLKAQGFDVLLSLFLEDDKVNIDLGRLTIRVQTTRDNKEKILDEYFKLSRGSIGFYAEAGRKLLKSFSDTVDCLRYISSNNAFIVAPPDVLMGQFHIAAAKTRTNYLSVSLLSPDLELSSNFISLVKRTGYGILAFDINTKDVVTQIIQWIKILSDNNIKVVSVSSLLQSNENGSKPNK